MTTKLMTFFTRSPLHVGAGASVGAVDQPVVRERHTRFPIIPGSSIKGVLADLWNDDSFRRTAEGRELFGSDDDTQDPSAGKILLGECKLLAFPVRSAKGCFAWLTCPLTLSRFARDTGTAITIPTVDVESVYVTDKTALKLKPEGRAIFEEYPLACVANPIDQSVLDALQPLSNDAVWREMPSKLAIVSDELFMYYAENACELAQHNRIDDRTGVVNDGALFNQENVPSETLFYSLVSAKEGKALSALEAKLGEVGSLLQIGADRTTGLGWCSVIMKEVK